MFARTINVMKKIKMKIISDCTVTEFYLKHKNDQTISLFIFVPFCKRKIILFDSFCNHQSG